jgi:hypothetical protein
MRLPCPLPASLLCDRQNAYVIHPIETSERDFLVCFLIMETAAFE